MLKVMRAPLGGPVAAYVDDGSHPLLLIDEAVPDDQIAAVESAATMALVPAQRR